MRKIKNLSIPGTIKWLYPRCIKLHTWFEQDNTQLPLERLSYNRFESNGIYWIESHSGIFLWIGKDASINTVQAIFGVSETNHINPNMNELPVLDHSPINCQLRDLYIKATENVPYLPQFNVVRHGLDLEVELSKVLVEDEIYNQMSYVDYLCMIHKQIQTEVKKKSFNILNKKKKKKNHILNFLLSSWKEKRTKKCFLPLPIGLIDIKINKYLFQ